MFITMIRWDVKDDARLPRFIVNYLWKKMFKSIPSFIHKGGE